jgi:hypothetical protein
LIRPHIFEIDVDVWEALSEEEISATVEAMKEFGIYKLPFDTGEIIVRVHKRFKNGEAVTEARGLRESERFEEFYTIYPKAPRKALGWYKSNPAKVNLEEDSKGRVQDLGISIENKRIAHKFRLHHGDAEYSRKFFIDGLVVLLASRGVVKNSSERKLAKFGIGKRSGEYTTTIKLARDLERHESVKTGHAVRPHLRRGHVRTQHHGTRNSLTKRIWVDPCMVNADENFVSTRKAYRVIH